MTSSTSRLLTVVGVLVALTAVAVAARSSSAKESTPERRQPSETLLDVFFSLYVVGMVLGLALLVALLVLRRYAVLDTDAARRSPLRSLVVAVLVVGLLLVGIRYLQLREPTVTFPELPQAAQIVDPEEEAARSREQYEAEFAWKPMLALAALLLLGGLAWWRAGKARRRARDRRPRQTLAEQLGDVLEETLDGLRAERDPRRAVIGAYARLERVAAASGLARRPAEAPLEYLGRMLGGLEVSAGAVSRLTRLFERAKFSHHEVDEEMKQQAIVALESVQEDLRQAELRARLAREEALAQRRAELRERARA
ncbi:MAG TPA: DUF4129 domain-containing protein [Gaiellaceae bacterium]|nr:DUF4129 domain-containing protein [Gaiellaceae bacterium]